MLRLANTGLFFVLRILLHLFHVKFGHGLGRRILMARHLWFDNFLTMSRRPEVVKFGADILLAYRSCRGLVFAAG